MSTPFTAWLRRASMALACGMASPAFAQAPQPFVAPQNPAPIPTNAAFGSPSVGQATVTFRPVAGHAAGPVQSAVQSGVVPATAAMPPQQPVAQHAHYQSVPGQSQHQVRQTALVQQYDEFVKQLPPSPSTYPLERAAQVIPTSLQGDPAPAPTDVAPTPDGEVGPAPAAMVPPARMMEGDGHGHAHSHGGSCNQCGKGNANCGCHRGPSGVFWVRADYLLWWTKGSPLPPLVTSSPDLSLIHI